MKKRKIPPNTHKSKINKLQVPLKFFYKLEYT